jgi:uncharacterized repeat protein (TIGR01451 family)
MMQRHWTAVLAAVMVSAAPTAGAVGTTAGTDILNTAQVSFELGGTTVTQASNTVTLTVAEILDVDVLLQSGTRTVQSGDSDQALLFTVTNTGNGNEVINLSTLANPAGDDFDPLPATPSIYFDTDGSGDLSAPDIAYEPGNNDPDLAPDESIDVLLVNNIPPSLADGSRGLSELAATAATGTGAPGTLLAGLGDGGVDALVGNSGAADADVGEYIVGDVAVAAVKSASVADTFGGSLPIPGATITYTIVVTASGSGTAAASVVSDLIPTDTTYVPGSLLLNGASLSDGSDADAGQFIASPAQITVALGGLSATDGPQTIQFQVTIN